MFHCGLVVCRLGAIFEDKVDDGEASTGALSFWVRETKDNGKPIIRKLGMKTDADDFTYRMFAWNKPVEKIEFDGKKFLIFADYKDYIDACKDDPKIEILSEVNNTYRTIVAAFISFGVVLLYDKFIYDNLEKSCSCANEIIGILVGIFVLFVFITSYKKQTDYIRKRVEKYLQKENDDK